jgi:hydroxymethylbilane synthase
MKIRLGTRGSALALVQSRTTASQLEALGCEVELIIIKTQGDLNQRDSLSQIGGKGVFVKEIEQALLAGSIDMAVHSLKDLPSQSPAGLALSAPPQRADARDALVAAQPFEELPSGARVGTGSARRQSQLRLLRPDLEYADIRGNVPTRVEKWRDGEYPGGVVLACAGLARLGNEANVALGELHPLGIDQCLPAPCQGILGLQYRQQDLAIAEALNALSHAETDLCCRAERAFLEALGGDCNLPAAGYAQVDSGQRLVFRGRLWWREEMRECHLEGDDPEHLGRQAASQLQSP